MPTKMNPYLPDDRQGIDNIQDEEVLENPTSIEDYERQNEEEMVREMEGKGVVNNERENVPAIQGR